MGSDWLSVKLLEEKVYPRICPGHLSLDVALAIVCLGPEKYSRFASKNSSSNAKKREGFSLFCRM